MTDLATTDAPMTVFAAPDDEAAVQAAVAEAHATRQPLRLRAGGSKQALGQPVPQAAVLDVSGVTGITRYEPGALVIEAKAATPLAEIEAALAEHGQMLAFEPPDFRALLGSSGAPTIGGAVAGNQSGPRRVQGGACRDYLLGVRFVDGQGQLVRNGGRVMKNVTGLDLSKLQCGAYGTLGVLTEVALKVLPRPEASATLRFEGITLERGVKLFAQALTTPFEVSGAAWAEGTAWLRIEGLTAQVAYRRDKLSALLADDGPTPMDADDPAAPWSSIRDCTGFADHDGPVWRLSLKASLTPGILSALSDRLGARGMVDQGGAVLWLALPDADPAQADAIRAAIPNGQGHAMLFRGPAPLRTAVPVFQPQAPRLERIAADLCARFDPAGILNPGLMRA
ncbi:glycolate oxidase subunit GlcE [Fluviibacterium sp. DFM31]|uniref:Glycolate oxidase subunit GlcE n=1 Tax=Meridianimarinicoccus marinus TaxID=3231483 RepID=A0ABV3L878_9RHOB